MFVLVLNIALVVAIGLMAYLIIRALPRVQNGGEKEEDRRGVFERWLASEIPEKADLFVNNFLAKWLRKFRVWILRLDNTLGKHLTKVSKKGGGRI